MVLIAAWLGAAMVRYGSMDAEFQFGKMKKS